VGENSPFIRSLCCSDLEEMGISIDKQKNEQQRHDIREINVSGSKVKVLVVPTNEEKRIAQETKRIINLK